MTLIYEHVTPIKCCLHMEDDHTFREWNGPCGCRHEARKSTYNRNELPKDYSVLTQ